MHILDLPDELLVQCCERLDMFAMRALRLTCKRMKPLASNYLFSHVNLLPTTDSANKARAILENRDLMPLVTAVSIAASLEDDDSEIHPDWDVPSYAENDPEYADETKHGIEINGVLSSAFKAMLGDIGLFPHLRRVKLKFDWQVAGPSGDDSGNNKEWTEYREPFFQGVLRALNHPEHPASKVHSLSIRNLQDYSNYDILRSEDFKAVLSRLDTLELSIATEENEGSPENSIHLVERHRFFGKDLIEFWLAPLQPNLVHLKIYSNCYWGYLPRCDFRSLRFPRLNSLTFGNMTFTHDWQLDWVTSHGDTLQSLILDDCPIVHDAMISERLDPERYVELEDDYSIPRLGEERAVWTYSPRWHDFFRKLATGFPHLRRFGMGHGPWYNCFGADNATPAFEASASLPASIEAARYVIFHSGTGPSPWIEPEGSGWGEDPTAKITELENQYDCCWDTDDDPPLPSYPDCWDRDQEAFDVLMAAVEGRRARKQGL